MHCLAQLCCLPGWPTTSFSWYKWVYRQTEACGCLDSSLTAGPSSEAASNEHMLAWKGMYSADITPVSYIPFAFYYRYLSGFPTKAYSLIFECVCTNLSLSEQLWMTCIIISQQFPNYCLLTPLMSPKDMKCKCVDKLQALCQCLSINLNDDITQLVWSSSRSFKSLPLRWNWSKYQRWVSAGMQNRTSNNKPEHYFANAVWKDILAKLE